MKNSNTSERLRTIMEERHLRQIDILNAAQPFCKKFGIKLAKNDLSQYVSGKVEPGQEKLTILGLTLDVSETWLMGYDVPRSRNTQNNQPPVSGRLILEDISDDDRKTVEAILRLPQEQRLALAKLLGISE